MRFKFTGLLALVVALFAPFAMMAQELNVSGTVTSSEDGLPMPGVSIIIVGTSTGTSTDFDGNYSIDANNGDQLQFNFIGYTDKTVAVTGSTMNVVMNPDAKALEEVVVTALGMSKDKKKLGYSVQSVGADELQTAANTNIGNALTGKVAGVNITNASGAAGAASFIEIRGASSISGNNQPLWVVDGVPIQSGGGISSDGSGTSGVATSNRTIDINPEDIADMTVLKGGAATALYGMRAANGVIMVTTKTGKSGKSGKLNVNFHASYGIDQISQVPEMQDKYGQGYTNAQEWWGVSPVFGPTSDIYFKAWSWGPELKDLRYVNDPNFNYDGLMSPYTNQELIDMGWSRNGHIVSVTDANLPGGLPLIEGVNTYDQYDFFQTGITQNYSVNVSKNTETSNAYFSYSHNDTKGVIPNNTFARNTFTFNASTKIADNFKVGASATYAISKGHRIQQGSNTSGVMLGLLRSPATFDNSLGHIFPDGSQRAYRGTSGYDNPYWTANQNFYDDEVNRLIGNLNLEYKPFEWMTVMYKLGADFYSTDVKDYIAMNSNTARAGQLDRYNQYNQDINSDLVIRMDGELTDDLDWGVMIGNNIYQSRYNYTEGFGSGEVTPGWANMANYSTVNGYEGNFEKRTAAYYGSFDISYANMIFFGATGRMEWSTTLPEDNNSFFYPSANLGFIFTEIGGLKDSDVLSFGKLRASVAQIANDPLAYGTTTPYYAGGSGDGWTNGVSFPFMGYPGFGLSNTLGNTSMKPETLTNFEVGVELNFWNNRLSVDAGYFKNVNSDLLLYVPVAPSSGITSAYLNAGEMETSGIELMINATIIDGDDFKWDVGVNWSNPQTKVNKLAEGIDNVSLGGFTEPGVRAVAGELYRSVYGLDWLRDDNGNVVIQDDPNDAFYGYPIQDGDQKSLGTVQANWTMGINTRIEFKGLYASALLDIKNGGQMWNGTKGAMYFFGTHADTENRDDDYVYEGVAGHLDGDGNLVLGEGANDVAVKRDVEWRTSGYGSGFTGPSSPFMEKTDWVRLREVALGYRFNKSMTKNIGIDNLEIYFTGRNLFLSTPYTGVDPETSLMGASNAQGFDYFNMPGTKSYTFGLKVGF